MAGSSISYYVYIYTRIYVYNINIYIYIHTQVLDLSYVDLLSLIRYVYNCNVDVEFGMCFLRVL